MSGRRLQETARATVAIRLAGIAGSETLMGAQPGTWGNPAVIGRFRRDLAGIRHGGDQSLPHRVTGVRHLVNGGAAMKQQGSLRGASRKRSVETVSRLLGNRAMRNSSSASSTFELPQEHL